MAAMKCRVCGKRITEVRWVDYPIIFYSHVGDNGQITNLGFNHTATPMTDNDLFNDLVDAYYGLENTKINDL